MSKHSIIVVRRYRVDVHADNPHDAVLNIRSDYGPLNGARILSTRVTTVYDGSGNEYEVTGFCDACNKPILHDEETTTGTDCQFHATCAN
jgi:hypothetical protein